MVLLSGAIKMSSPSPAVSPHLCFGFSLESRSRGFVPPLLGVRAVIVGQQKEAGGGLAEDLEPGVTCTAAPLQDGPNPPRFWGEVWKLGAVPSHVKIICSLSWN